MSRQSHRGAAGRTDAARTDAARTGAARTGAARTLLVLFFCAGIALLGLLAGGEHRRANAWRWRDPMAGYYPEGMPRYPRVREVPAGRDTRVGGSRVRMSTFVTNDEPFQVAAHYVAHWRQLRFFVRSDVTHMGGVVSAVDVSGQRIFQLLLMVHEGRTVAFPSVTTAPSRALESLDRPFPVPLIPGSRAVLHLGSREGQAGARVSLSVNDEGLTANLAHYRAALRQQGYAEQSAGQQQPLGPEHRILLFRKAGSEVTVNLSRMGGKRVRVHIMVVSS